MKILVFVDQMIIGGVQLNSIELNARLRDVYGHDMVLFGTPGSMVRLAQETGLRFLPAPHAETCPSFARMRALREAVRRERPDLIQAWDWRAALDAYYSAHLFMRVPMHVAHADMSIDRLLPKTVPTTLMTPQLVDLARAQGRRHVELLLPPVDTDFNAPGVVDPRLFREQFRIKADEVLLVTVSRLSNWMKGESLRLTIDIVRTLGRELPLKFVIVGDGDARGDLERLAGEVNGQLERDAIVLTGELLDPRPAYAAADIVIGMGGSSLRGMAFGKPVIIVGKQGFSAPFTPTTADIFYYTGMYGSGDGRDGHARLATNIRELTAHPEQRSALGEFSRRFVVQHFSLETACARLEKFSRRAVEEMPGPHHAALDGLRTALIFAGKRFVPKGVWNRFKRYELKKEWNT